MLYQIELLAYGRCYPKKSSGLSNHPYFRLILWTVRLRSALQYFFSSNLGEPSATLISVR